MSGVEANAAARENAEDEVVLGVLDAVERDRHITQRHIARELGIALGLANAYLRRCVRKGLVKVSQAPRRRYAYYLTPQGFTEKSRLTASYLAHSFSFFRRARAQCGEIFASAAARGQRRLVLVGGGDLAEIASLFAREYPVEIAGVIAICADADQLAAAVASFGIVDAAVVTALVSSRETYEIAIVVFGPDRVYAPSLLRLRRTTIEAKSGQAA
jgi:DNA-binding MarR family transcriptional regulator